MKQKLISPAKKKRLDRFADIKKEFSQLEGDKTEIVKALATQFKASTATIYKALNS
jgi:hypothetical protein